MIGSTLQSIRKSLGFQSARAFYLHLKSKGVTGFNYPYYMKIEANKVIPSTAAITTLGDALDPNDSSRLVLAYCTTVFPQKRRLFEKLRSHLKTPKALPLTDTPAPFGTAVPDNLKPRLLNRRQIAAITESRWHYYLFLILTLARQPISFPAIALTSRKADNDPLLNRAVQDLKDALVITEETGASGVRMLRCVSNEMRFPKADSPDLKKIYATLDTWDPAFSPAFGFEDKLKKMLIRRVSARYVQMIMAHCDLILELVRNAEEEESEYNNDVLFLNLQISKGQLPG